MFQNARRAVPKCQKCAYFKICPVALSNAANISPAARQPQGIWTSYLLGVRRTVRRLRGASQGGRLLLSADLRPPAQFSSAGQDGGKPSLEPIPAQPCGDVEGVPGRLGQSHCGPRGEPPGGGQSKPGTFTAGTNPSAAPAITSAGLRAVYGDTRRLATGAAGAGEQCREGARAGGGDVAL